MTDIHIHPSRYTLTVATVDTLEPTELLDALRDGESGTPCKALLDTPMPPTETTRFAVATDGDELCIAVCLARNCKLRSQLAPGAAPDQVEIIFDPFHDRIGYQQFVFTPGQTPISMRHYPYEAAHSTTFEEVDLHDWFFSEPGDYEGDGNPLLFCARFGLKGIFRNGRSCGFNIARNWPPDKEVATWNPMSGHGIQDAASLGDLFLDPPAIELGSLSGNLAENQLSISSDDDLPAGQIAFNITDPFGDDIKAAFDRSDSGWSLSAPLTTRVVGRYRLTASLDGDAETALSYWFEIPRRCRTVPMPSFSMGMVYDVNDDFGKGVYTKERLANEISTLADHGVSRLYWIDTPPITTLPEPLSKEAAGIDSLARLYRRRLNNSLTFQQMGDLLHQAVAESKRQGLELITIYKPFDQAINYKFADDSVTTRDTSLAAKCHPFIAANPQLTQRCHPDWQMKPVYPIRELRLWSRHPVPELAVDEITILSSSDNRQWQRYDGPIQLEQGERERNDLRWGPAGNQDESSRRTDWCLSLSGLNVTDPYVAVKFNRSDVQLSHRGHAILDVIDADGQVLTPILATTGDPECGFSFWREWRSWRNSSPNLIDPFTWGNGWHGFTLETETHLHTLLDPAFSETRDFWCQGILRSFESGADGVSVRTLCHHNNIMDYMMHSYAEPIRQAFREEFGREVTPSWEDCAYIRRIRGDFYTDFVRQARAVASAQGSKMIMHLEAGVEIPPSMDQRMQFHLDWERWMREGLVDELLLKWLYHGHPYVQERILPLARKLDIPVHICDRNSTLANTLRAPERARRLVTEARSAGFAGYHFYETADYMRITRTGRPQLVGQASGALLAASQALYANT